MIKNAIKDFFFKQKTAYEMRISDWSSDVCSSDLDPADALEVVGHRRHRTGGRADHGLGQKGDDLVLPQLEDLGLELIGEALGVGLVTLPRLLEAVGEA